MKILSNVKRFFHKKPDQINHLPDEMLLEIFNRIVSFEDCVKFSLVCRRWNRIAGPHIQLINQSRQIFYYYAVTSELKFFRLFSKQSVLKELKNQFLAKKKDISRLDNIILGHWMHYFKQFEPIDVIMKNKYLSEIFDPDPYIVKFYATKRDFCDFVKTGSKSTLPIENLLGGICASTLQRYRNLAARFLDILIENITWPKMPSCDLDFLLFKQKLFNRILKSPVASGQITTFTFLKDTFSSLSVFAWPTFTQIVFKSWNWGKYDKRQIKDLVKLRNRKIKKLKINNPTPLTIKIYFSRKKPNLDKIEKLNNCIVEFILDDCEPDYFFCPFTGRPILL